MNCLRNRIATLANMWAREGRKAEAEVLRGILDQDRTSADDHRAYAIERLATVTAMSRDQATDVVDAIIAAAVRTQEDLEGAERQIGSAREAGG